MHLLSGFGDRPQGAPVIAKRVATTTAREGLGPDLPFRETRFAADSGFARVVEQRRPLHRPFPVPAPVRSGEPSERFPKHWTVMTWVPGEPLDHGSISRGAHAADTLAAFLRALHAEAPADAPASSGFGAHPKRCTGGFEQSFRPLPPAPSAMSAPSGPSGPMPWRLPSGRDRWCGRTVTSIPRMSSSRTGRPRA
ncbi:phosphotransferase [Nonomuraea fuscirosea]|nr:phosphotransferase [Nonomuraea fuscirosea]